MAAHGSSGSGSGGAPLPSAKVAISAFCSALQLAGLPAPLESEAVRQAKFATGEVREGSAVPCLLQQSRAEAAGWTRRVQAGALWLALHDLVILRLANDGADGALAASGATSRLWAEIQAEEGGLGDPSVPLSVSQEGQSCSAAQAQAERAGAP